VAASTRVISFSGDKQKSSSDGGEVPQGGENGHQGLCAGFPDKELEGKATLLQKCGGNMIRSLPREFEGNKLLLAIKNRKEGHLGRIKRINEDEGSGHCRRWKTLAGHGNRVAGPAR